MLVVGKDNSRRFPALLHLEIASLALATLAVILIAGMSYLDWAAYAELRGETESSERVVDAVTKLLSELQLAETGQRGFLLTGRATYLEPYHQAVLSVPQTLTDLLRAVAWRPDQAGRLLVIQPLVQQVLDELRDTIGLYQAQGSEAAVAVVLSDRGEVTMELIHAVGEQMESVAKGRIAALSAEVAFAAHRSRLVSIGGGCLIFALLIVATITIRRGVRRRDALIESLAESENALRVNQQLLESVVNYSPSLIYVKELSGRYSLVNRRYKEVFPGMPTGMGEVEKPGHAVAGHTDDFRVGEQRVASSGSATQTEEEVIAEDGVRTYLAATFPILNGNSNSPLKAVGGIWTDITERKRMEQRLNAQLERLALLDQITRAIGERQDLRSICQIVIRSLEEDMPIDFGSVCLYDAGSQSFGVTCVGKGSQVFARQMGMTESARIAIEGNDLSRSVRGELIYEPDMGLVAAPFPRLLSSAGLNAVVIAPLLFESQVFGVLIAGRREASSFSSADCEFLRQLSGHVALACRQAQFHTALQEAYDDLRQTRDAVMQQERLRALGEMASGIAHDINNAISPMALYTESLLEREPNLSQRTREYLELAQRCLGDVGQTVSRMHEFYRRREPHDVKLAPVQLNLLVRQVLDLTRARWCNMPQERGILIQTQTDLAEDLPDVSGIESEIREALVNLILNAVDAMPDGGTLSMHTRASQNASGSVRHAHLEVRDSGIGMDENTRRRCIEPFFTTKGQRGTGLGLAMVFGILQRHRAEIEIDSAPGKGTTVLLSFPVPAAGIAKAGQPTSEHATPRPLHILAADDDPLILKALRESLEGDGHLVATANGGRECVDAFRNGLFDVVITDLGMPGVDGRRVASEVKAIRASTPVILLTGWGERLLVQDEIPEHIDRVLSKPPKLRELRSALAMLTARSRKQSA
jgi:signal transduction histidine kinase/CHASE3 domain sensor protein/ActR/RegA family two-component response regulator